jgi:hypothetical protein
LIGYGKLSIVPETIVRFTWPGINVYFEMEPDTMLGSDWLTWLATELLDQKYFN